MEQRSQVSPPYAAACYGNQLPSASTERLEEFFRVTIKIFNGSVNDGFRRSTVQPVQPGLCAKPASSAVRFNSVLQPSELLCLLFHF